MTFSRGDRVRLNCGCLAVVKSRLHPIHYMYVVTVEQPGCVKHGRRARAVVLAKHMRPAPS